MNTLVVKRIITSSWNCINHCTLYGKHCFLATEMPVMLQIRHSINGIPEKPFKVKDEQFETMMTTKHQNFIKSMTFFYCDFPEKKNEALIEVLKHILKYNLLKVGIPSGELLETDEFLRDKSFFLGRSTVLGCLRMYGQQLESYIISFTGCLFHEHLVKHCSHIEVERSEIWKFKVAFPFMFTNVLLCLAKNHIQDCVNYRNTELPQDFKDHLLREVEEKKETVRCNYGSKIPDEISREIEADILKMMNLKIVARMQ